jgi:integrase
VSSMMHVYQDICTRDLFPSSEITDPKKRRQRQSNLKTSLRYLAAACDETPERLSLTEAIEATYQSRLRSVLTAQGKGASTIRNTIQDVGQFLKAYHQLLATPPVPVVKHPEILTRIVRDGMTKDSPDPRAAWLVTSPYWVHLEDWPADVQALWKRYREIKKHRMRESTFTKHLHHLEAYVGYLSMSAEARLAKLPPIVRTKLALHAYKRDREDIIAPPVLSSDKDLFALSSLEGFVTWLAWRRHPDRDAQVKERPPSKPTSLGFALAGVISSMAHHLKRKESKRLIQYCNEMGRPEKIHDKKAAYHTFTIDELDQVGHAMITQARQYRTHKGWNKFPGARAAIMFQRGLILLLGIRTPMRARQWAEALLDDNLKKVNGEWRWDFRGKQLKIAQRGRAQNEYTVPITDPVVVKLLEEYLEVWRQKLPRAHEDRHIFLTDRGAMLNHATLCAWFKLHVYRYTGKRLFPHLLRTIFTSDAINRGVSRNLVAYLLNDTPQTVDLRYNEVNPGLLEPSMPDAYARLFPKRSGNGNGGGNGHA